LAVYAPPVNAETLWSKVGSNRRREYFSQPEQIYGGQVAFAEYDCPHRGGEEPYPMLHEHEKSDAVIVAVKAGE
jgi:hypothetical protein